MSSCCHFPHVFRIGSSSQDVAFGIHGSSHTRRGGSQLFKESYNVSGGLISSRKRTIRRDNSVVKAVEDQMRSGDYLAADALLIRNFSNLAQKLLVPLDRYCSTLLPSVSENTLALPQKPIPFSRPDFFYSLKLHDTPFTLRKSKMASTSHLVHFYDRFLDSPNFIAWLNNRMSTAEIAIRERYLNSLITTDIPSWEAGRTDAELNDLLGRLQREMYISDAAVQQQALNRSLRSRSFSEDVPALRSASDLMVRASRLRVQAEEVTKLKHRRVVSSHIA